MFFFNFGLESSLGLLWHKYKLGVGLIWSENVKTSKVAISKHKWMTVHAYMDAHSSCSRR